MVATARNPQRWRALERAGFNVMNLQECDLTVDLFTDIQPRAPFGPLEDTRYPDDLRREPALAGVATELYGPARYVATTKGRGAENALAAALWPRGGTAIGHPLFMSFEYALKQRGVARELTPWSPDSDSCDVDLDWLGARLAAGGVDAVVLEPACNAFGGRPLGLENAEAAARLAREHGARLVLDATRLLGNCQALGMTPLLDAARAYAALADAITVSCAKELLSPYGGFVGVPDLETQRAVWQHCRMEGTLLEPHQIRVALAQGCERMLRHPEVVAERERQLAALAESFRGAGVPFLEPIGAHAVYVQVPAAIAEGGAPRLRAMEAHIYLLCGARVISGSYSALPGRVARLALGIGRYRDDQLAPLGPALRQAFDQPEDALQLSEVEHEELSPNRVRYRPVEAG